MTRVTLVTVGPEQAFVVFLNGEVVLTLNDRCDGAASLATEVAENLARILELPLDRIQYPAPKQRVDHWDPARIQKELFRKKRRLRW